MRVIHIPAALDKPIEEFTLVNFKYPVLNKALAERQPDARTEIIERVHTEYTHGLIGGNGYPTVVMIVDEEGRLKNLPFNLRAAMLYHPRAIIAGDAFLVGEGMVLDEEGFEEPDFISLPDVVTIERVTEHLSLIGRSVAWSGLV